MRAALLGTLFNLALALLGLTVARAASDSETTVYARVVVDRAEVRAGPSATFRRIYAARRDEVFPVRGRATEGYWFQIELPDGTTGFIRGDLVYNHEVGPEQEGGGRFLPEVFAPPPLLEAHGEIALQGGVLGTGGMLALRPTWLLDPSFGFELTGAAAVASGGRLLIAMVGPIVNVFPRSPIVPFFTVGGGIVASSPNADTFLLDKGSVMALSGGAGLRIGFRWRLTLRLEARTYVMFESDRYVRQEEFSAGLTVFF
ncbi:MAG TPA: SH3 domain-containing protein [Polyangiales bacterium]|nr:SH3 domain-containing protein [Polyangiales bacterium]